MAQKSTKTSPDVIDFSRKMVMRIASHQRRLYLVGLLTLISVASFFFFKRYQHQQNEVAQREMFQAVYYFEQELFDKALNGDGTWMGLLDIIRKYRFTKAANLAYFYVGVSYMHQKDYTQAIRFLTKFRSKDLLLRARAWALIGDASAEQKNYRQASDYYMRAAAYKPNKVFTPIYLIKAAVAYEADKDYQAALGCYQRIIDKFPGVMQYGEAVKHGARLKELNTKNLEATL